MAGFSIIEILLVIVIIGIMVTVAVPSFIEVLAKTHDTERLTALQRLSRAALTNGVNSDIPTTLLELQEGLTTVDAKMPVSDSIYCYVYGSRGKDFFTAVMAESSNKDFLLEGTKAGANHFRTETVLQETLTNCATLSTPTAVNGYEVFYLP